MIIYYSFFGLIVSLGLKYSTNYYLLLLFIVLIGFSISGPYSLGGLVISEFDPINKGKITAISSLTELVLSPITYYIGKSIANKGWDYFFISGPIFFSLISLLFLPYVIKYSNKKED